MSEFPYLYRNSFREAQRFKEVEKWRSSHQENVRCCQDIGAVVSAGLDAGRLREDCAQDILYRHGFKRVQHVLANTVHELRCASQMDKEPLQWLQQIFVPRDKKYSPEFAVQVPPAVLDQFTGQVYQAYQALGLFGPEHCIGDRGDYTGKVLVMSPDALREECWSPGNMLWLAEGGFGCSPTASGRAVYATCLGDGEQARWDRADFIGALDEKFLPDWALAKLSELRGPQQEQDSGPTMGGMG